MNNRTTDVSHHQQAMAQHKLVLASLNMMQKPNKTHSVA